MSEMHFESVLSDEFRSLIAMKRALGYKYETDAGLLRRIDSFLVENGLQKKEISRELCEKWCRKRSYESPANHSSRISIMRVFCRYLSDIGIKSYIPPMNLATKAQKYDPHIYTTDELSRFFSAVECYYFNSRIFWTSLRTRGKVLSLSSETHSFPRLEHVA